MTKPRESSKQIAEPVTDTGDKHEDQSVHRIEAPKEQKATLKEISTKKDGQTKDTKSVASKEKELSAKIQHET